MTSQLTPTQPYFIKALYNWCLDNGLTPHIIVEATSNKNVRVPMAFVKDGHIVLNINPVATGNFSLDDDSISFTARFGGVPHNIFVPFSALRGIYPREHYEYGLFFEKEEMEGIFNIEKEELSKDLLTVDNPKTPIISENKESKPKKSSAILKVIK